MKLTKAEAKALGGDCFYWSAVTGITWANPPGRDSFRVRNDVFDRLHMRDLVKTVEVTGNVHWYVVTDAGRAALASANEGNG